jgi:hypothetical protein
MSRRDWLWISGFLCACARRKPATADRLFPGQVARDWKRTRSGDELPDRAPEPVRQLGVERVLTASYQGPGEVDVTLYEMKAPTVAFELAQKWRPEPESVFFYQQQYFVLVRWRAAGRDSVSGFVRGLEQHLTSLAG